MFKSLSALGDIAGMMRQAQEMSGKMQAVQQELRNKKVTGTAGGGMVEVEVNGAGEMLSLKIDPTLIERNEQEMIEDLIPAAVNQACAKAKELSAEMMQSVTAGLNVPGLDDAISQMTGPQE